MRNIAIALSFFLLVACGKDPAPAPVPPPPAPVVPVPPVKPAPPVTFQVQGKFISVEGTLKAGTVLPLGHAETAVKTAVRILETKR